MYSSIIVTSKIHNYEIKFIEKLDTIIKSLHRSNTLVVIDSNVNKLYPKLSHPENIVVECNENAKTLEGAYKLLQIFIERKANTKTQIVVIGGGILQDLVGFCSSIYCRGIDYILVPTTLLAQTDSCVGGKTSINFYNRKNILGTFYPPKKILIFSEFLKTLTKTDYISGLGEIYKFHILQNKINGFDIYNDIGTQIYESLKYKTDILHIDEFDKKERKFLNYGHTFGHALENISNYEIPHGLAVILGCMISTRIAKILNYSVSNYEKILSTGIDLFRKSQIILKPEWFDAKQLLQITKSDKKSTGKLTMVLVDNKPFIKDVEDTSILTNILKQTYESI